MPSKKGTDHDASSVLVELQKELKNLEKQKGHQALGLEPNCGTNEVESAYLARVMQFHPDRFASHRFVEITQTAETILVLLQEFYQKALKQEKKFELNSSKKTNISIPAPNPPNSPKASTKSPKKPQKKKPSRTTTPLKLSAPRSSNRRLATNTGAGFKRRLSTQASIQANQKMAARFKEKKTAQGTPKSPLQSAKKGPILPPQTSSPTTRSEPLFTHRPVSKIGHIRLTRPPIKTLKRPSKDPQKNPRKSPLQRQSKLSFSRRIARKKDHPSKNEHAPEEIELLDELIDSEPEQEEQSSPSPPSTQRTFSAPPPARFSSARQKPAQQTPKEHFDPDERFKKGLRFFNNSSLKKAQQALREAISSDPEHAPANTLFVWVNYLLDPSPSTLHEAKTTLAKTRQDDKSKESASLFLGKIALVEKNDDRARALFKAVLGINKSNIEAERELRLIQIRGNKSDGEQGGFFKRALKWGKKS